MHYNREECMLVTRRPCIEGQTDFTVKFLYSQLEQLLHAIGQLA